LQVSNKKAVTV